MVPLPMNLSSSISGFVMNNSRNYRNLQRISESVNLSIKLTLFKCQQGFEIVNNQGTHMHFEIHEDDDIGIFEIPWFYTKSDIAFGAIPAPA